MIYRELCGEKVSLLGMGNMRLPIVDGNAGHIDYDAAKAIIDYLYENGVNYFDTAYGYHNGASEKFLRKALADKPRDSFFLATKMPGHEVWDTIDPAAIFQEQLDNCGVEYFDFYLLHNVYGNSFVRYTDEKLGILDQVLKEKEAGRIRHLGFSCHGDPKLLAQFLDCMGDATEFVQLQVNYMDWTLQEAAEKYRILTERKLPLIVMEPLRGGQLAGTEGAIADALAEAGLVPAAGATPAQVAFRWLEGLDQVRLILSGMNTLEDARENVATFAQEAPLEGGDRERLEGIAKELGNMQPCTRCRYCCRACPQELDIPYLIKLRDDCAFGASLTISMAVDSLAEGKRPGDCLKCGACERVCPQNIGIPRILADLAEMVDKLPKWADLSRARTEARE